MKNGIGRPSGMETPVSMFLLFSAALLIASIGDALLWNENEPNDLFKIRSEQVRSMGRILASWEPEDGNGTLLDLLISSEKDMLYHAGENIPPSNSRYQIDRITEFFECTPDDLDPFILIEIENSYKIEGEHVQWMKRTDDDVVVRLMLPLKRGGLEVTL